MRERGGGSGGGGGKPRGAGEIGGRPNRLAAAVKLGVVVPLCLHFIHTLVTLFVCRVRYRVPRR